MMPKLDHVWKLPDRLPNNISKQLENYPLPFQSILYQRGIDTSEKALDYLVPGKVSYSARLQQIDTACQIISSAISNNKHIFIYGDYDADGITSTAVLTLALRKLSANVTPVLPNRFLAGYGLSTNVIDKLYEQGAELLITVDNGIRSHNEINHARSLGMKVIVTDHHSPDCEIPNADAILNPKSPDDPYPNKHLSGVGVVYKLVDALSDIYPELDSRDFIDLVAIGTVADIVPLVGENRILVKKGLSTINNPSYNRQSIISMLGAANMLGQTIRSSDISFQIAPRLNSSGRLDTEDYEIPLKLLLTTNPAKSGRLAQVLENHNHQRKLLSTELQQKLSSQIKSKDSNNFIFFSFDKDNNLGVAGIAASYITHKYHIPAVIGHVGPNYTTASCRSIPAFDITAVLDKLSDLFEKYGGHKMAAGFTIRNDKLSTLQKKLLAIAETDLAQIDLRPTLEIDAIIRFDQITQDLLNHLDKMEPTGQSNPPALFMAKNIACLRKKIVGKNSDHLHMSLSDGNQVFNAIGFGLGDKLGSITNKIDIVFHLSENQYRGTKEIQLQVLDIMPSENKPVF
jgi:single-stranded-DNA-specific exonuclease